MFKNKVILITGGAGSFGRTFVNKIIQNGSINSIKELRIFSRDENKQDDMRHFFKGPKLKYYIGNVKEYSSIDNAMQDVDVVFHAAALRQVPSCEFHPIEAIKTNSLGTKNILDAAIKYKVKRVVALSTDKAVYPISAMGMSKALMEKIVIAKAKMIAPGNNNTVLCCTRHGNVMASRSSVIPLFIQQIKNNQPITITDPTMTRFLMSLDDFVNLVLYAFQHGNAGDIFVQKSPACTLYTLAKALMTIFDAENDIRYIDARQGEKKHESLVSSEEMARAIDTGNYYRIPADTRVLGYSNTPTKEAPKNVHRDNYTSSTTTQLSVDQAIELLLSLDCIKEQLHA